MRILTPYFDTGVYHKAYAEAATAYKDETKARTIAGAATILDAIAAYRNGRPAHTSAQPAQIGPEVINHITAISVGLHRPRSLDSFRRRVTNTENSDTYA
ncbi:MULTISPECIES: DUF6545 domain-containing protein [unclassified Streptomyces]|uniref:DUF6545 domain-containing protein n=1 Tax=unclassified Streptomyces TaxID=2593676 RepID=UPI0011610544|nr:DUF6545 domain-containing protein [Streptomyces sp. TSRI0107]